MRYVFKNLIRSNSKITFNLLLNDDWMEEMEVGKEKEAGNGLFFIKLVLQYWSPMTGQQIRQSLKSPPLSLLPNLNCIQCNIVTTLPNILRHKLFKNWCHPKKEEEVELFATAASAGASDIIFHFSTMTFLRAHRSRRSSTILVPWILCLKS